MKNEKKEIGLVSPSGICIDGDILLNCVHDHSSSLYLPLRLLLAFMATFSTAAMANAFIGHTEPNTVLFYHSLISVLAIGAFKSKYPIIKLSAGVISFIYLMTMYYNRLVIKYGFFIAVENYMKLSSISPGGWGVYTAGIDRSDPTFTFYFMALLIFIVAFGSVLGCVFRIDFPLLFLFTFPIFELGMYQGMEAPTLAVLGLLGSWITVLSMHIINHTTNKAGRKNTFAVHERSKSFFFTSKTAKAEFYPVMMSFVSILTAAVFTTIVIVSTITGFTRTEGMNTARANLHRAISSFSISNIDGFIEEASGGKIHRNVRSIGGTNGGLLGRNEGIAFNGSTAMYVTSGKFTYPMYLRGYIGGEYSDNTWNSIDISEDEDLKELREAFAGSGHYLQDAGFMMLFNGGGGLYGLDEMQIDVRSAEKTFAYVPYFSNYASLTDLRGKEGTASPRNDTFVSLKRSEDEYSVKFFNFNSSSGVSWPEIIRSLSYNITDERSKDIKKYDRYVKAKYTDYEKLDSLEKAYDEINNRYLDGTDYFSVYRGIKNYLDDNYDYDLTPGATPAGEDFIDYFLTSQSGGYCSYFATVGVELLRMFGYPARYVEGYMILPGQQAVAGEENGFYTVKVPDQCAHAWAEVYLEGLGWVPAEFTPGYENDNPELDDDLKDPSFTTTTTTTTTTTATSSLDSSDDSSKAATSATTKKSGGNGPGTGAKTTKKNGSKTGTGSSGASKDSSESKDDSSGIAAEKPKKPMPAGLKSTLLTGSALIIAAILIALNRMRRLKIKKQRCSQSDLNKRIMDIYRYTLKYLGLLGIEIKKNLTDLAHTEELLAKCHEKHINGIDEMMTELTELAVKAQMSGIPMNETEAAKAAQTMRHIANKVVLPKLNRPQKLAAMFLHCLY